MAVFDGVGGEQQQAGDRGEDERRPGDRQHVGGEAADGAVARGQSQQAQVDHPDGAHHEGDAEHVDGLDPGEQQPVLADRDPELSVVQPLKERFQLSPPWGRGVDGSPAGPYS